MFFFFFRSVVEQTIGMRRFMSLAEAVAPASGSAGESLPPTSAPLLISPGTFPHTTLLQIDMVA